MHRIEDLSLEEREACIELKRRVSSEITNEKLKNDVNLYLRFLRARDFKLDIAEAMLRNHIAWRVANQIERIHTAYEPEEVVIKYLPLQRIGFDKEGSPIRFFDFGKADIKGILKCCKTNAVVKSVVWMFEEDVVEMRKQSEKLGKNIQQWVYILDFDNYSFAKATHKQTAEVLIQLFLTYEANYPERLKAAYVVNSSVYFTIIFSIIKPLLSGNTLQKIKIYGRDGYKEDLLKAIDADVLPAFLGGTRTDPDGNPKCPSTIKLAVAVPKKCYKTKNMHRLKEQPEARKLIVSRKSKMPIELSVVEAGSVIEWEFETESKDIGFALSYKESANNKSEGVELIPKQRIDTNFQTETGMFQCEKPGVYILMFDNSYSWIYQKEIYVKIGVVRPKERKEVKVQLKLV
ncbi:SEC14-like protein 2 [Araneus ventricosus]|uniref:SEC14-like protein 2 n=1 Tax=Araneus ventricosus TaxID=182803 RepID=A0A4Y2NJL0_ARAVE|nr:SEC14-like protein 2 [Araneus ventricosus]